MYFTRQTEIAISILTICARRSGNHVAACEMADHTGASMAATVRIASLLVRNGLLCCAEDGGMQLAVDPASVSLGTILRITQPSLLRPKQGGKRTGSSPYVFGLVVQAASSNFVRLAERYTVADFVAERTLPDRLPYRGRTLPMTSKPAPERHGCRAT